MRFTSWGLFSKRNVWTLAALFFLIAAARCLYVSLFAVDTPFWDQWDSEADLLLRPWKDGTWTPMQLFSLHNEHRIAFTRLLSIALFELNNGQWNNLTEAYVNTAIAGLYLCLLFAFLARESSTPGRILAALLIGLAGVLPFSWENFLVGFQSQFYFMALLAILMMALAAFRVSGTRTTLLLTIVGFASLFTAASGFVGAIGVMVIVAARSWRSRSVSLSDYVLIACMLLVVVSGLYITPSLPYHEPLKAAGIRDNFHAVLTALMWPIQPLGSKAIKPWWMLLAAAALWAPSATWLLRSFNRRDTSRSVLFALGMAAWAFIQCVAIAHSRGHNMMALASRYMDIPAIAVIVNGWLAAELLTVASERAPRRSTCVAVALLFVGAVLWGFIVRNTTDMGLLQQRVYFTAKETANVRGYMLSGDAAWLDQPTLEIPYPSAARLKNLLDNATIAEMLPPSIRRPVLRAAYQESARGSLPVALDPVPGEILFSTFGAIDNGHSAPFRSPAFHTDFPYVALYAAGSMSGREMLNLNGEGVADFASIGEAPDSWRRAYARTDAADDGMTLSAHVPPGSWLAFTSPVEAGRLSVVASVFQDYVRKMVYHLRPKLRPPAVQSSPHGGRPATSPVAEAPAGPVNTGGQCDVDTINGKSSTVPLHIPDSRAEVRIVGWAVLNAPSVHSNNGVLVEMKTPAAEYRYYRATPVPRPDVSKALGSAGLEHAGFEANIPLASLPSGIYALRVLQLGPTSGDALACPLSPILLEH